MFPLKPKDVKLPSNEAKTHEAHTSPTKFGMGNYYGTGVKAKLGRMRSDSMGIAPVNRKQFKTPPKTLA